MSIDSGDPVPFGLAHIPVEQRKEWRGAPELELKSDNPKNLAARSRVKIALLPAAGVLHGAHAAQFGADKYGPYNWREKKIALMEYASAIMRHVQAWVDGEDNSPGEAHHLGHVIAGASIMLDAIELGTAIDDRPSKGTAAEIQRRLAKSGSNAETESRPGPGWKVSL